MCDTRNGSLTRKKIIQIVTGESDDEIQMSIADLSVHNYKDDKRNRRII